MTEHLTNARQSVQQAADSTRANVREQLLHVEEGLMELESGDKTSETVSDPDRLETVESKLAGLIDTAENPDARGLLQDARDELDLHRRARGLQSEE